MASCYQSHSNADAICSSQIPHLHPSSAYLEPFDPNSAFPIRSYAPGSMKKSDTQNGSSQKTNMLFHKIWTLALFLAKWELRTHITTLGKNEYWSNRFCTQIFFHSTCTKLHTQTNHISYDMLQLTAQIQIVPYIFCLIVNLQSQQLETNQLHTQPNPNQVNLTKYMT